MVFLLDVMRGGREEGVSDTYLVLRRETSLYLCMDVSRGKF
jgi:hypothetical protein